MDDVRIETAVRLALKKSLPYQIAATYASAFFLQHSEEMSSKLAERVVLAEGDKNLVAAAQDALTISADFRVQGRCSRCGEIVSSLSTRKQLGWAAVRVSSKLRL
jgi:hypothetical protein